MAGADLKPFIPLVSAIAETFGKNCEVVLHDFSKPARSIIAISNGHVTGRDIGCPATDFILSKLKNNRVESDFIAGYSTKTEKGVVLKSTTTFIKNAKGKVVGALCINIDVAPYISAKNVLEKLSHVTQFDQKGETEKFESSVDNLTDELLERSIKKLGKPVSDMRKEDNLQIIRDLRENGLFLIKGSAKRVSKELNVSLATVYKYIEEIE